MLSKEIPEEELVIGILDSVFMLDVINRLMFNYKVLMYQSVLREIGGLASLSNSITSTNTREILQYIFKIDEHYLSMMIPRYSGGNEKLGVLTYIEPETPIGSAVTIHDIPNTAHCYQAIKDYALAMKKVNDTVNKYEYLKLSVRALDMVLPPEHLNKLNSNWVHTPYWGSGTDASPLVLTELREGLDDLISQSLADDAMAMVLH